MAGVNALNHQCFIAFNGLHKKLPTNITYYSTTHIKLYHNHYKEDMPVVYLTGGSGQRKSHSSQHPFQYVSNLSIHVNDG